MTVSSDADLSPGATCEDDAVLPEHPMDYDDVDDLHPLSVTSLCVQRC